MLARVGPVVGIEAELDQRGVADAEPRLAGNGGPVSGPLARVEAGTGRAALVGVDAQHTVRRIHQLIRQGRNARLEQPLSQLGPVASGEGHLEVAQRRPGGQRSQADEPNDLPGRRKAACRAFHA